MLEHPDAKIEYEGDLRGVGQASFKAERRKANDFSVTITKEGCDSQTVHFNGRKFRGWAFVGTLVGFTAITSSGIPLPWGIAVDGITGAWFKPDINEIGVSKQDYNHFIYEVNYTGCVNPSAEEKSQDKSTASKAERLRELKKLLDEGVITEKEYDIEKNKILNEN